MFENNHWGAVRQTTSLSSECEGTRNQTIGNICRSYKKQRDNRVRGLAPPPFHPRERDTVTVESDLSDIHSDWRTLTLAGQEYSKKEYFCRPGVIFFLSGSH
ncbi:hypothetical protein CDAR_571901 [Caerostris darwini]|uniref:Uncharacterized protein n=1 Tax=Caerostris darwini TaxID=1538125 RepID=A0AAV4PNY0_9ARAC|nr:hypothetical protein CDAR_571901 [Caerostris darwini]